MVLFFVTMDFYGEEPKPHLNRFERRVQNGLLKYADMIYANEWMIKFVEKMQNEQLNVCHIYAFYCQLRNEALCDYLVFKPIQKWVDVPEQQQRWVMQCVIALQKHLT